MKVPRFAIAAAAVLLLTGTSLISLESACSAAQFAPDFKVTDLKGKTYKLSDYSGKVLFLNFWATWCPPCKAEIPDFVEVYKTHREKGLEILGISLDRKGGREAIVSFVEKYEINYPVVLESQEATEKLVEDFQPGQFIPTTIIITQGQVRQKHVGLLDKKKLLEYFEMYSGR
jgi:peroxiredoxin